MRKLRMNKRGFTLAELCVVIALIAIATLLMTSFMAVFQTRTAQNTARHDFLDEVALVRDHMEGWIEASDFSIVKLVVPSEDAENALIIYRELVPDQNIIFENGVIIFNDYNGQRALNLKSIKKISLTAYKTDSGLDPLDKSGSGKLLRCTLTGEDVFGQEFSQNLIFSLDSDAEFVNGEN